MKCVYGKTVYTGAKVLNDAYVCFEGQTIRSVGSTARGEVVGEFAVITPAIIDAHSHIGMLRAGEPASEAEANEQMDPLLALPDALDSVQMDDSAMTDAVEMGVLYSCVVPGSGNILGGSSAFIRHWAASTTDALVARCGVKAAFGFNPMSVGTWKGQRPTTRMGAMALLRAELDKVRAKIAKRDRATGTKKREIVFTAAETVLRDVLAGKTRLRCHVHKTDDIAMLLRLVDEFKLNITVEHAMDVHDGAIFAELKRRGIPVTYGPIDVFAYKVELRHANWRNAKLLLDSGVEFGLMTDHPVVPSRQLLHQTRWFIRAGMNKQDAIEIITRRNAKLLGVDAILGTLARGKWASLIGWTGDPFDITNHPAAVFGEGKLIYADESD